MLIWKINALICFCWMKKKTSSLTEDKRSKDKTHRAYTHQNPKRHIPPVSLLLWRKMVTMRCFVWALGLRLWSVSETKFRVLMIKKNLYPAASKRFLVFNVTFDVNIIP